MKKRFILLCLSHLPVLTFGQEKAPETISIHQDISTHFISPEPIKYVDISTDDVAGDIPVDNILRVKPKNGKPALGVVTIVGERFMVQYRLSYASTAGAAQPEVRIDPAKVDAFLNPAVSLSTQDMQRFALAAVQQKPEVTHVRSKSQKVEIRLNNIYTVGDYFFLDVSMRNRTNIAYDLDRIRFLIEDRKVMKATNFQQLEVKPVYTLYGTDTFRRRYRNVFVFRKFTFPDEKVFHMEVAEEQVSGRTISLKINYRDVLKADTL